MLKEFLLVLLLAAGLRFTAINFDSFWLDEGYQTVVEAYGNNLPDFLKDPGTNFIFKPEKPASTTKVLTNFRKVDPLCPPLFALLVNRWLTIFGGTDFSLRAFPVICSILSIVAIYYLGSLLVGKKAALYASLLQSISPFDIGYAQEARMYSLCTLLAAISGASLLYLCLKQRTIKDVYFGAVYVISTWALINSHYTQLFFWIFTVLLGYTIAFWRKDKKLLYIISTATACVLVISIPWISLFLQATQVHTASFYVSREPSWWWFLWALFIRIPFNWLTFLIGKKVFFFAFPLYITSALIIGPAIIPVIKEAKNIYSKRNQHIQAFLLLLDSPIALLLLWALVPSLMIWILDIIECHRVIEVSRYLIGSMPAVFLLGGCGLEFLSKQNNKKYFYSLTLAHALFCFTNNAYMHLVPQKENWRELARIVEKNCDSTDILFVSPYYNIVCLDRYLDKPMRQIGLANIADATGINSIIEREKTSKSTQIKFWVLAAQQGDTIFGVIPSKYQLIKQYDFPHALHLRQYQTH